MCVLLIAKLLRFMGRLGAYKSSWVIVVTTNDRPKSVRTRYVIEVFGGIFVLSLCFLRFAVGIGFFCNGTESDLYNSFFSLNIIEEIVKTDLAEN